MHSLGKAIDINPVQNPVIYPNGVTFPEGAQYFPENRGTFAADNAIVQEFIRLGWHWGEISISRKIIIISKKP